MKDRTIVWCLKQKRGIWIVQPNENLTKAYLKKAASALNIMNAALELGERDWSQQQHTTQDTSPSTPCS